MCQYEDVGEHDDISTWWRVVGGGRAVGVSEDEGWDFDVIVSTPTAGIQCSQSHQQGTVYQ